MPRLIIACTAWTIARADAGVPLEEGVEADDQGGAHHFGLEVVGRVPVVRRLPRCPRSG